MLDGDVLAERDVRCGKTTEFAVDAVLPQGGVDGARFTFEVTGDPAVSVLLDPVVGPLDIGTYGRRPWNDARPDLVGDVGARALGAVLSDKGLLLIDGREVNVESFGMPFWAALPVHLDDIELRLFPAIRARLLDAFEHRGTQQGCRFTGGP